MEGLRISAARCFLRGGVSRPFFVLAAQGGRAADPIISAASLPGLRP